MISKITKITLCKKQFSSTFDLVLNIISFGDYGFKKSKHGFTVYHCYLIVHCNDGRILKIDKQARVKVNYINNYEESDDVIKLDIKLDNEITPFRLLFNTQEAMGSRFNNYCFINNNCSSFMTALLLSNGFMDDEYLDFVKQDALKYLNSIEVNAMIFICMIVNCIYKFI
jgi:hypothetical protein